MQYHALCRPHLPPGQGSEPYFWPNEQQHEGYLNMDYYGGDLPGIRKKLTYLQPWCDMHLPQPHLRSHANHVTTPRTTARWTRFWGPTTILAELCRAAKARGIDVVLDGVFSHTGSGFRLLQPRGPLRLLRRMAGTGQPVPPLVRFFTELSPRLPLLVGL